MTAFTIRGLSLGRTSRQIILSAIIAAISVWYVGVKLNWEQLYDTLAHVNLISYILALASFISYQWFRTIRTKILIGESISSARLMHTICLHCFVNNIMPVGIGEFALVYLLRRLNGVNVTSGSATLITSRIVDLTVFIGLFAILIGAFPYDVPSGVTNVMVWVGVSLVSVIMALALAERMVRLFFRDQTRWAAILRQFFHQMHLPRRKSVAFALLIWSSLMWFSHYLAWVFAVKSVGLSLSMGSILWIYLMFFPLVLLPARGIMAMGPRIAAWFYCLQLVGVAAGVAAPASVSIDILMLSMALIVGVPSFVYFSLFENKPMPPVQVFE